PRRRVRRPRDLPARRADRPLRPRSGPHARRGERGRRPMKPGSLVRLAFAGTRTDTLRVVLTGISAGLATVALLAAATVLATPDARGRYSAELLGDGRLRAGV